MNPILVLRKVDIRFGPIHAVRNLNLAFARGSATALIGTNGAGKSTALLAIADALPSSARMSGIVERAAGCIVSIVPERNKIFALLSVAENLLAADRERGRGTVKTNDVFDWFPRLAERRHSLAGNLSGGEQQMLAIGMALLGSPSLLILDEPTLGLAVPIIERICETLAQLRQELNLTLIVAEAETTSLPKLADEVIVVVRGEVVEIVQGNIEAQTPRIRDLMLGLEEQSAMTGRR